MQNKSILHNFTLKAFVLFSAVIVGSTAYARVNKEAAAKFVPGAQILKEDGNEFDFKTAKNTVVEVELDSDGAVDEASGDLAHEGDVFNPSNGHLTLEAAVAALQKAGKNPAGDWSYEKSIKHGWIYEFEGHEDGKKMEYNISATDGRMLTESKDR